MLKSKFSCAAIAILLCLATPFTQARTAAVVTTDNLLVNGNAESHRCTDDWSAQTPVPGWHVLRGAASVLCYSAFSVTQEAPNVPSGALAGNALFAAPGADTAMEQVVNVTAASSAIDKGNAEFKLSAWLGGWHGVPGQATLTAVFLDDALRATGSPVVLADAETAAREGHSRLVAREAKGLVPPQTRQIVITVHFVSGMTSFHNAFADNLSLTLVGDSIELGGIAAAPLTQPASTIAALDHVYVVMLENTNYSDVVHGAGRSVAIDARMPFLASLAKRGVVLTNMWGNYHPSDQNYVAMVAGDTYKYGPVYFPDYDLPVNHLGDLLEAKGKTWRAYVQNMNTPCNLISDTDGYYAPDDQPFVHFRNVIDNPERCAKTARDLKDFASAIDRKALPDFAWIAADGWWDGEGAWWDNFSIGDSLVAQDAFLKSTFEPLIKSAQWRKSKSLLVVTWDESLGWGWPDNRVPTVLIGSPGLLQEGTVVDHHYDGYSVLRSVEAALRLDGLDRFDRFAEPLDAAFASEEAAGANLVGDLWPAEEAATRGGIDDTFGRVTIPTAIVRGKPLRLVVSDRKDADTVVSFEPLGQVPVAGARAYRFDDGKGVVTIPTERLEPGVYGAWLRRGAQPAHRAPLLVTILPRPQVSPELPGVEIVGASGRDADERILQLREVSNPIVRYCRPAGSAPAETWIGVFPVDTPADQMTKENANVIGFWLKTPGAGNGQACGEAMAFASELPPGQNYQVFLFRDDANGTSTAVGRSATFTITPALP
jgi:hypothetical protein